MRIGKCDDALKKIHQKQKLKNRFRNIIWFNPLLERAVSTNVAKSFLRMINRHFPKFHRLNKILNRNTMKVTYICMQNETTHSTYV